MTDEVPTVLPAPTGIARSPAPTAEEAAAIVAAYEVLRPQPAPAAAHAPRNTAWRFGNRWWSLPIPVRRERPWR